MYQKCMNRQTNRQAAGGFRAACFLIPLSLVAFLALVVSGCATKEDVYKVEERVMKLERSQNAARASLARIDSLARESSSVKTGDYAQLAAMMQDLSDRIDQLSSGVADLQDRLSFVQSRGGSGVRQGQNDNSAVQNSGIDCVKLYDDSFILFRQGEYQSAQSGFADFLNYCGKTDLADRAQYWVAESYYERKDYVRAAEEFGKLVDTYRSSTKLPTALYKLGRCSEETGFNKNATDYYRKVVEGYPATPEAGLAKDKLTELTGSASNKGG